MVIFFETQMKLDHYPDPMLNAVMQSIHHEIGTIISSSVDELNDNFELYHEHYKMLSKQANEMILRVKAIYPAQNKELAEIKLQVDNKIREIYIEQCRYAIKIAAILCVLDETKYQSEYRFLKPFIEHKNLEKSYDFDDLPPMETLPF